MEERLDLSAWPAKTLRMKIEIRDGDLFSLQFPLSARRGTFCPILSVAGALISHVSSFRPEFGGWKRHFIFFGGSSVKNRVYIR